MTDTTLTDSLTVQNVFASTAFDAELDLQSLTEALDGATYVHHPCPSLTYHPPRVMQ
jgi:TATA-box binding protein (TBP) (component of TFIID and TFIIIB)